MVQSEVAKLQAVQQPSTPWTKKQVRAFIGLCGKVDHSLHVLQSTLYGLLSRCIGMVNYVEDPADLGPYLVLTVCWLWCILLYLYAPISYITL